MRTLNKNLLMGGVAACAVAFTSCGDEKADSAAAAPNKDTAPASATDTATDDMTETVSLNLSGLK